MNPDQTAPKGTEQSVRDCSVSIVFGIKATKVHKQARGQTTFVLNGRKRIKYGI